MYTGLDGDQVIIKSVNIKYVFGIASLSGCVPVL